MKNPKIQEALTQIQHDLAYLSYVKPNPQNWETVKTALIQIIKTGDEAVEVFEMENK